MYSAKQFFEALGVNAHAWYVNNPWPTRLVELGIPNVRGKAGTSKDFISKLQPFFSNGGKLCATMVASKNGLLDRTDASHNRDFLKNYVLLKNVSAMEGPNEFNINHTTNWASYERDYVKWFHDTTRADPAFNGIPIVAPSIWKRLLADYKALGDISAYVDKGCIHYYSGNRRPTLTGGNTMQGSLKDASILAPGKPIYMTETGWQAPSGSQPISVKAAAKYALRNYFDAFGNGVEKIFYYELIDDQSNLFGLCDANANPKPAFTAIKNLAALVRDTLEPQLVPLDYTIAGAPASMKQTVLQKANGEYLLALYLDVDSYNAKLKKDVDTNASVSLKLTKPASISVYSPTFSDAVVKSALTDVMTITVSDQVTLVRIAF